MLWIAEFKKTNAYEVWERVTDPLLFDILEPRYDSGPSMFPVPDVHLSISDIHAPTGRPC